MADTSVRRRVSVKRADVVAAHLAPPVVDQGAAPANADVVDNSYPTRAALAEAVDVVLASKDLRTHTVTIKTARRDVVRHMNLGGKWLKRSLEGTRRQEFHDIVTTKIAIIEASMPVPPSPKPDWLSLEDEGASVCIYLVTSKIKQYSAA